MSKRSDSAKKLFHRLFIFRKKEFLGMESFITFDENVFLNLQNKNYIQEVIGGKNKYYLINESILDLNTANFKQNRRITNQKSIRDVLFPEVDKWTNYYTYLNIINSIAKVMEIKNINPFNEIVRALPNSISLPVAYNETIVENIVNNLQKDKKTQLLNNIINNLYTNHNLFMTSNEKCQYALIELNYKDKRYFRIIEKEDIELLFEHKFHISNQRVYTYINRKLVTLENIILKSSDGDVHHKAFKFINTKDYLINLDKKLHNDVLHPNLGQYRHIEGIIIENIEQFILLISLVELNRKYYRNSIFDMGI